MAEILPRHYVYGIIFFTLVSGSMVGIVNEFGHSNPDMVNDPNYIKFSNSFNQTQTVTDKVGSLRGGVEGNTTGSQSWLEKVGPLGAIINSLWTGIKVLGGSFDFLSTAFMTMGDFMGVPSWIAGLITLSVTVLFLFALISIVFQKEI